MTMIRRRQRKHDKVQQHVSRFRHDRQKDEPIDNNDGDENNKRQGPFVLAKQAPISIHKKQNLLPFPKDSHTLTT